MAVTPEEYGRINPEYAATDKDAWTRLLAHEMTHRLHVEILGGDEDAMGPTWFFEGFAMQALSPFDRVGSTPELDMYCTAVGRKREIGWRLDYLNIRIDRYNKGVDKIFEGFGYVGANHAPGIGVLQGAADWHYLDDFGEGCSEIMVMYPDLERMRQLTVESIGRSLNDLLVLCMKEYKERFAQGSGDGDSRQLCSSTSR